ncbi:MAG: type II CRISPR RNA-guided endonuclease Cas9 [Bacillota bacterium]|nr:type II CRISPR RNA-guided endonuclease Cas9 [Bacillota bacterium]
MSKVEKFYLGLDIGTNSVGFAVTNEEKELIRKRGKHLWGVRLFDEAQTAADRRAHRTARRRLARRKQRIVLLQSIFAPGMDKVDRNFFNRLECSYVFSDSKPALIFESKQKEAEYFRKYPTIYHLRKALLENEEKFDLRLIYLAVAHMIKYRGNFLKEGTIENVGNSADELKELFDDLDACLIESQLGGFDGDVDEDAPQFKLSKAQAEKLLDIFKKEIGVSERLEGIKKILPPVASGDKRMEAFIKAFNGNTVQIFDVFPRLKEDKDNLKDKLKFDSEDFEDKLNEVDLTDSELAVVLKLKQVYDYRVLARLLKGKKHISDAMVELYEAHKRDLRDLKKASKLLPEAERYELMDSLEKPSYARYVGTYLPSEGGKPVHGKFKRIKKVDRIEFIKVIKKSLKLDDLVKEDVQSLDLGTGLVINRGDSNWKLLEHISSRIANGSFLAKQNNKDNGVFPYQLNENELRLILEKQGKHYPFLLEKGKGFPNPEKEEYKIVSLLRYRIPYYVGPIGGQKQGNHWAVRKGEGKVDPWNFFDLIDAKESGNQFIANLRNTCSYIYGEETLPKFSLLYQKFVVLNELNNLSLNERGLTAEEKQDLIENVYLKERSATPAKLNSYLKNKYGQPVKLVPKASKDEEKTEFVVKSNLSSWIDMSEIFGEKFYLDREKFEKAELAIKLLSVFEDQTNRLTALRDAGLGLNEQGLKKLASKRYKGWGRLSRRLLLGIKSVDANGEICGPSILKCMEDESLNFMEVYEDLSRGYKQQVESINKSLAGDEEDLIENSHFSPAMKRAFRQALKVTSELQHIVHIDHFDKIFVETTRSKQEKKATKSRKKFLNEVYAAAKGIFDEEIIKKYQALLDEKATDDNLRSKHIFLYFMQLGHDVYTGKEIVLNEDGDRPFSSLSTKYDIDHIIPQAYVKDDSFTNTVLVESGLNRNKSDVYPIERGIITPEGREWIEKLYRVHLGKNKEHPLMPSEKKSRLLRSPNNPLSDQELSGFINRQLVMTSQSVKATCEALKILYPESEVIYSKAGLVSDFRNVYGLIKVRDLNNYHHAHDAYLNIVVGDVYNQVFNNRVTAKWLEENPNVSNKVGAEDFFSKNHRSRDRSRLVWDAGSKNEELFRSGGTIDLVRKTLSWNDPMMSTMTHEQPGGLFKLTLYPKGDEGLIPLKQKGELSDVNKYGGYKGSTSPFFALIKSKKGKKTNYSLEGIPAYVLSLFDSEEEAIRHYVSEVLGLSNAEVILPKVLIKTVIVVPGQQNEMDSGEIKSKAFSKLALTGRSGSNLIVYNLSEPTLPREQQTYLKAISKYYSDQRKGSSPSDFTVEKNLALLDSIVHLSRKDVFATLPSTATKVFQYYDSIYEKFVSLSIVDQADAAFKLYRLLLCKPGTFDLSSVGLSKIVGVKTISKNLVPGTKLIKVSPTGYYQKVLFEVPKD